MAKLKKTTFRITFEDGTTRSVSLQPLESKKCIIKFEASKDDIKNGIFGFDEIPKDYDKKCTSDITALENEYQPLIVEEKKYFPAWISMRKDQTIILDLKSTIKQKDEYESIAFEKHPDFTITPIDKKGNKVALKEAKKVKITCKNTNLSAEGTTQIKVIADGKDAGALNFWYPKPKTIDLKWHFVEITGDEEDKGALENKIDKTKLEILLKKGLNPALIDVNIVNTDAETIDMTAHNTKYFKKRNIIKKQGEYNYIESDKKELFAGTVQQFAKPNLNIVNLYIVNRSCISTTELNKGNDTFDAVAGFSPTNTGIAFGILTPKEKLLQTAVMHEIMHALGLPHLFSEKKDGKLANEGKKHLFKDKSTENYMDYDDSKEYTYKWQWEKLHTYAHLK